MPVREHRGIRRTLLAGAVGLAAMVSGSAFAAEPNDTQATASGPLTAGKTFSGSLETLNDVDYQFFYIPNTAQVTITTTNAAKPEGKAANRRRAIAISVVQARKGKPILFVPGSAAKLRPGKRAKAKVTLAPGKYLMPVIHAAKDPLADIPFRIRITPPGTTTDSYEIFARRCAAAIARVNRVNRSKKKLVKRLQRAKRKGRDAKVEKYERKLEAKRKKAKVVQRNKRIACSVPR